MQKAHSGPHQIRWSQWLSQYRLKFIHIPGSQNRSADALSRLFENPNSKAQLEDLSTVDLLLDKDGDDLTKQRIAECEMFHMAVITHANILCEVEEPRQKEADAMIPPQQEEPTMNTNARAIRNDEDLTVTSSASKEQRVPFIWQTRMDGESRPSLKKLCRKAYPYDRIFKKILRHPTQHQMRPISCWCHALIMHWA